MLECCTNDAERYSSFNKCKKKDLAILKNIVCLANLGKAFDHVHEKLHLGSWGQLSYEEWSIWFKASIQFAAVYKNNQGNLRVVYTCTDTFMGKLMVKFSWFWIRCFVVVLLFVVVDLSQDIKRLQYIYGGCINRVSWNSLFYLLLETRLANLTITFDVENVLLMYTFCLANAQNGLMWTMVDDSFPTLMRW